MKRWILGTGIDPDCIQISGTSRKTWAFFTLDSDIVCNCNGTGAKSTVSAGGCGSYRGQLLYPGAECTSADAIFTFQLWIRFSVGVIQINNLLFELQSIRFLVFRHVEHFLCYFACYYRWFNFFCPHLYTNTTNY